MGMKSYTKITKHESTRRPLDQECFVCIRSFVHFVSVLY